MRSLRLSIVLCVAVLTCITSTLMACETFEHAYPAAREGNPPIVEVKVCDEYVDVKNIAEFGMVEVALILEYKTEMFPPYEFDEGLSSHVRRTGGDPEMAWDDATYWAWLTSKLCWKREKDGDPLGPECQ